MRKMRFAAALLAAIMAISPCSLPVFAVQAALEENHETANRPAMIAAPDAEEPGDGEWREVIEEVYHDEVGHYENQKTGEVEVVDKEAWDERVRHWFYECTICRFRSEDVVEINDHLYEHPTGADIHYYDPVDGDEIFPSYREECEYVTVHHDAETHMEDVYEDVWVIDREAYIEEVHTGVYRYFVNGVPIKDTLAAIGGDTYLFNSEGVPVTGWHYVNDSLYYFGDGGMMQTGWLSRNGNELYADPETGKTAMNIVLTINNTSYYFNSEGIAFTEGVVEDNGKEYYFDGEELVRDKWVATQNGLCYYDTDGTKVTGIVIMNGRVYPVGDDGTVKPYQWVAVDGRKYYTDNAGAAVTGFKTISGRRYYFADERKSPFTETERGKMMTGWVSVGSRTYYFADNRYSAYVPSKEGIMLSGWKTISGRKYYFMDAFYSDYKEQNKGILLTGFREISGKMRYLTDNRAAGYKDWKRGIMLSGHATIGGKKYFFSKSGVMAANRFATLNGEKYYFRKNGTMATQSWVKVDGRWFYLEKSGKMHKGLLVLNGMKYYCCRNGVLAVNRWITVNGCRCWADANGILR